MSAEYLLDPGAWLEMATPFNAFRVRVLLVREGSPRTYPAFTSSASVHSMFRSLGGLDRELFLTLLLDTKQRLTGVGLVSVGTLDASLVHPREVFKPAVVGNAAAVICVHNHPSGDPTPSRKVRCPKTLRFGLAYLSGGRKERNPKRRTTVRTSDPGQARVPFVRNEVRFYHRMRTGLRGAGHQAQAPAAGQTPATRRPSRPDPPLSSDDVASC